MKVVIPAAGMGTRFLPLTKESPKEMLPVLDRPTIHWVVQEAIDSGVDDILIITGRGKKAIVDYFDSSPELESFLESRGKTDRLESIRSIVENGVDIHYIRQKSPNGLGDAVLHAKKHVGDEYFAVLLGDNITLGDPPALRQLMDVHERLGGSVIAVERVPREKIHDYGIIDGEEFEDGLFKVDGLVEKPEPEDAPSDLAITGTYILSPRIFDCLERTQRGHGGELQLTDALQMMLDEGEGMHALIFDGRRYDVGDMDGWLMTNIEFALMDDPYRERLGPRIRELVDRYQRSR